MLLDDEMSQFAIVEAINHFNVHLDEMVEWGGRFFETKMKLAGGNVPKGLLYWNGGGDQQYDDKVLARRDRLVKELGG